LETGPGCGHAEADVKKLITILVCAAWALTGRAGDPEKSVIQILVFAQPPAWETPWRSEPVRRQGGSGFVIQGKRIMTNAHVVSWARQILVRRYQDARPYVAEVEFIGHDCDLAVLTVADARFFADLPALEFGGLPKVRSTVVTYGYPAGGEEISYTRGVVSRIELEAYAQIGNRHLLAGQTDAAINPGNSGGPVIQDDHVVGVAFQGLQGLENTGFFIPPPVIQHFLKDIDKGHYEGFPHTGIRLAALQNPAYRERLKLPDNDLGARVDAMLPISDTTQALKEDDVILQAGAFPVASDATILYQGNRLGAALAFQLAQAGESVPLRVWRQGREEAVSLKVGPYSGDKATGYQHDGPPRYFVYAGLVFTPLSLDYLRSFGRNNNDTAHSDLIYELYYHRLEHPETARTEPVVLAALLPDAANANFGMRSRALVDRINGVRIDKIDDVIRAFETGTNTHDVIQFVTDQALECLDHAEAAKANASILKNYAVTKDRRL